MNEITEEIFQDIPTFSEWLESEEKKRRFIFVALAMSLYTSIRITAMVCATIIALRGNLWLGGALFFSSLFIRFQFNAQEKSQ